MPRIFTEIEITPSHCFNNGENQPQRKTLANTKWNISPQNNPTELCFHTEMGVASTKPTVGLVGFFFIIPILMADSRSLRFSLDPDLSCPLPPAGGGAKLAGEMMGGGGGAGMFTGGGGGAAGALLMCAWRQRNKKFDVTWKIQHVYPDCFCL